MSDQQRFLTTDQLVQILPYDERTVRERLTNKAGPLQPGRHVLTRPGGRKLLYNWTAISADMGLPDDQQQPGDLLDSDAMSRIIQYDERTLRESLVKKGFLKLGTHYFRLPQSRKFLFLRAAVVDAMGMKPVAVSFKPAQPSVPASDTGEPAVVRQPPQDQPVPPGMAFTPSATDFWAQAAQAYLDDLPEYTRPSTRDVITTCVHRDLAPFFAQRTCSEITFQDVVFAIEAISSEYGRPHAVSCFRALQAVFDSGTKLWGVPSPIKHLKEPPRTEKLPRVLRIHDAIRLIAIAPEHYRPYFIVRLFTGISTDEAHSLRARSILLDTEEIRIDEVRIGDKWVPLDERRTRTIKMPRVVKEAIVKARTGRVWENADDLVFTDHQGRALDKARFNSKVFVPLLNAAGIQPMQLRELSNTAPFLWLCANCTPEEVAEWSGYGSDSAYVLSRFGRLSFNADGYSNLDRMLAAATSDEARHQLAMPLALPLAV